MSQLAGNIKAVHGQDRAHCSKIPLTYNLQGTNKAIAKGSFVFKRTDFEIGSGIWSNTLILKDDVTVNVSLALDLVR